MTEPWSLVDEGENSFMIQNNETGKQQSIAKSHTPKPLQEEIRKLPKFTPDKTFEPDVKTGIAGPIEDEGTGGMEEFKDPQYGLVPPTQPIEQPTPQVAEPVIQAASNAQQAQFIQPEDPFAKYADGLDRFKRGSQAAIMNAANIQAQGGRDQAAIQQDLVKRMQAETDAYNQSRKELDEKSQSLENEVKNTKIDPNRWWSQQTGAKGFGKRILAFMGMVLGGGAQLRTGVNPTSQALSNLINQDIDSQKENLQNKKSLLNDYYRKYGNLDAAHHATFVDMATMAKTQLDQIAANTQSNVVRENAKLQSLQLGFQIDEKKHELAAQAATQRALGMIQAGTPSDAVFGRLPKEYQERAVRLPDGKWAFANTSEDAKKIKEIQAPATQLSGIVDQMREYMAQPGAREVASLPFMPFDTKKSAEAESLRSQAMLKVREIGDSLRLSEGTLKFLEKMIPNPASLQQEEAKKKLDLFSKYITNTLQSSYASRLSSSAPGIGAIQAAKTDKPF